MLHNVNSIPRLKLIQKTTPKYKVVSVFYTQEAKNISKLSYLLETGSEQQTVMPSISRNRRANFRFVCSSCCCRSRRRRRRSTCYTSHSHTSTLKQFGAGQNLTLFRETNLSPDRSKKEIPTGFSSQHTSVNICTKIFSSVT